MYEPLVYWKPATSLVVHVFPLSEDRDTKMAFGGLGLTLAVVDAQAT
jgi:hypothetical protein